MAPGGAMSAALVPRPEREGTHTTPGVSVERAAEGGDLLGGDAGHVPRDRKEEAAPRVTASRCANATAAV